MLPEMGMDAVTQVMQIGCFPWAGDVQPRAWARCGRDDRGLRVVLWCEGVEEEVRYTRLNDPVYTESCLEAFLRFYGEGEALYLNVECNAKGAMLLQRGTERAGREYLTPASFPGVPFPEVKPFAWELGWGVDVFLPWAFVQAACDRSAPPASGEIRGNFYKCDERPGRTHFACWAPIAAPKPDFHRPECFRPLPWD